MVRADIQRILHKKSMYIVLSLLFGGFTFLQLFIVTPNVGETISEPLFRHTLDIVARFSTLIIGIFTFYTVYIDDFSSNNLSNILSVGIERSTYVFSKLIVMVLFVTGILILGTVFFFSLYGILALIHNGAPFHVHFFEHILYGVITLYFGIIAFSLLVQVILYSTQSALVSIFALLFVYSSAIIEILDRFSTLSRLDLQLVKSYTLSYRLFEVSQMLTIPNYIENGFSYTILLATWGIGLLYILFLLPIVIFILKKVDIKYDALS
ncbi:hypothetical protein [Aliicoccus persicus]|uniref:hypothetical protein n=1 Tax=Aliicoccus persicus TaxID=930138 RepID=UPI00117835A4|nr:hypothetical protein [Aliicoccus persicus]